VVPTLNCISVFEEYQNLFFGFDENLFICTNIIFAADAFQAAAGEDSSSNIGGSQKFIPQPRSPHSYILRG
jgi:hypothetical protein